MLSREDIEMIRSTRAEITHNRTEPITLIHVKPGAVDPWTGEPTGDEEVSEVVDVVWKEYSSVAVGERSVIGGIELKENDVKVSFEPSVVLSDVDRVIRQGEQYTIVTIDEKGLGGLNRYETIARRMT
jgi:hypothetical protein